MPSSAHVHLHLASEGLGPDLFTPLRPPDRFDADLTAVDPDLMSSLTLDFQLDLTNGRHPLPLTHALTLPIEVRPGLRAIGRLTASRHDDGDGAPETRVDALDLTFEHALIVHDIMPVLARLSDLLEDAAVSELLDRARQRLVPPPDSRREWLLRKARSRLPVVDDALDALEERAAGLAYVSLQAIRARPVLRHGIWQLDLRFSGLFHVLGAVPVPFHQVHLPHVIIPWPHASLTKLLSDRPLPDATLHTERVPLEELTAALAKAVQGITGTVALDAELPSLSADLSTPDRARYRIDLERSPSLEARGTFLATLSETDLHISARMLRLKLDGAELAMSTTVRVSSSGERSVAAGLTALARQGDASADGLKVELQGTLRDSSHLPSLDLRARFNHPILRREADAQIRLDKLTASGSFALELDPSAKTGVWTELELRHTAAFQVLPGVVLTEGGQQLEVRAAHGQLTAHVSRTGHDMQRLEVEGDACLDVCSFADIQAVQELDIEEGRLKTLVVGDAHFTACVGTRPGEDGTWILDFDGTGSELTVQQLRATLGSRTLTVPTGSTCSIATLEGHLETTGLGRSRYAVAWDLGGASPVLSAPGGEVELLVPDLRQGALEMSLGMTGELTITGEEHGLYDARYFNALIHPDQETDRWIALLSDDEATGRVIDAVRLFSEDLADSLSWLRRTVRRAEAAAEAEGIDQPADGIPAPVIARMISRMLVDSTELADRLLPLVQRVVDGDGLHIRAVRDIIEDALPDHEHPFEIDRALRWLGVVLSPTDPVPTPPVRELPSLAEHPDYTSRFAALPTAREIHHTAASPQPLPEGFALRVARVAPYLSESQITWLLGLERDDWGHAALTRLRRVAELKARVRSIADSYGGPAHALQASAISLFLGSAATYRPTDDERIPAIAGEPADLLAHPDCLIGPHDAAWLLRAGLAAAVQGGTVQLNQRLLLELVLAQPAGYLRQVLYEMSQGISRVLAGVLMALLDLEQGALREPLDLVASLSGRLDTDLPRLADFLAGGRWASQSYYEALDTASSRILAESEACSALQAWLQTERLPQPTDVAPGTSPLEDAAQQAIEAADAAGRLCTFTRHEPARRRRAIEAYQDAFAACRAVIEAEPRAFQWPWLKAFWARNHEALMVRSVVRNVQQDIDRVRPWLRTRLGKAIPRSEQGILRAVVEVLYFHEEDRQTLLADPLVRLLIDPPEGHYDFTIVSCMGVVTDGAEGRELEDTYARLTAERGVEVIRANTATARSLEFNAERVEEAARRTKTPWGYIGYSQGCANGLRAETLMLGGTPDRRAIAERLVCRHFLFSAFNGTPHSTGGDQKFLRAMIDAEHFASHYQAVFSKPVIEIALQAIRRAFDAPIMVQTLGGVDSLSYEGAASTLREVQIKDDAPTTQIRGVVQESIRPEALDLLSNLLTKQAETDHHDTQVMLADAVGHPVHVRNPQADAMRACDTGSMPQIANHWSPLLYATDFVTTRRDKERAIYDFPKDRHVFPWVEVNARFGVIGTKAMAEGA